MLIEFKIPCNIKLGEDQSRFIQYSNVFKATVLYIKETPDSLRLLFKSLTNVVAVVITP